MESLSNKSGQIIFYGSISILFNPENPLTPISFPTRWKWNQRPSVVDNWRVFAPRWTKLEDEQNLKVTINLGDRGDYKFDGID